MVDLYSFKDSRRFDMSAHRLKAPICIPLPITSQSHVIRRQFLYAVIKGACADYIDTPLDKIAIG